MELVNVHVWYGYVFWHDSHRSLYIAILFFLKTSNRKFSFFLPKDFFLVKTISLPFFAALLDIQHSCLFLQAKQNTCFQWKQETFFWSKVFNFFATTISWSKTPRLFTLPNSYQLGIEKKVKVFCSAKLKTFVFVCFSFLREEIKLKAEKESRSKIKK